MLTISLIFSFVLILIIVYLLIRSASREDYIKRLKNAGDNVIKVAENTFAVYEKEVNNLLINRQILQLYINHFLEEETLSKDLFWDILKENMAKVIIDNEQNTD